MLEKLKKIVTDKSILRFLIVGGCCTLIDIVIYMIIVDRIGPIYGKGISMICSMIFNYFLNKFWSFAVKKRSNIKEVLKYVISQIANLIVNISINAFLLKITETKIIAYIVATVCAMLINYLLQRYWVFKSIEKI